jgi:hypothetical protein
VVDGWAGDLHTSEIDLGAAWNEVESGLEKAVR